MFGARAGDSGSAIFGRAVGGGVDFVGLLVGAWCDKEEEEGTLELPAARCGLAVPASRVFAQLHHATGKHWTTA